MSFNDIIGQEIAKKILSSHLRNQRIANAYLFYGPDGIGKTSTAITFAKALNCEQGKHDSCDRCTTCKEIESNRNPDFELITPGEKGNILIEQIKNIKERYSYRSIWLKFRVTIIKEADTLTEEAANSFLKLLEEPPCSTVFILTTSKKEFIFPTIRSRCQEVKFGRLSSYEIENFLKCSKAIESKISIKSASQLANGSIKRALRLLETEENELRNNLIEFLNTPQPLRMQEIGKIELLDETELLLFTQELYMDSLFKKLGIHKLIKNNDLGLNRDVSIEETLKAIVVCNEIFYALKQNVDKKLVLYRLAKELP
ncbi:MAG: DNA polymerase III subunit [bacterium]|nr:DNA polymerase III subunit [bacterium]